MSPSRKSAWPSTSRSRRGCIPVLPSAWCYGDGGTHLCALPALTVNTEGAAQRSDPLPHTGQAQGLRLAVSLAARKKPLTIIGNHDCENPCPVAAERNQGLVCCGVLANVGQGFLDEPEELERGSWGELVGSIVRLEVRLNLVPLFKLLDVVLECADQPSLRHVGTQPSNGLSDILVEFVGN